MVCDSIWRWQFGEIMWDGLDFRGMSGIPKLPAILRPDSMESSLAPSGLQAFFTVLLVSSISIPALMPRK